MLHKAIWFPLAALIVASALISPVSAQERLRLAWAGFSPTNSPIWVMEDRKLLQKQGITPEIIAINASPTVLQALLADELSLSQPVRIARAQQGAGAGLHPLPPDTATW